MMYQMNGFSNQNQFYNPMQMQMQYNQPMYQQNYQIQMMPDYDVNLSLCNNL